MVNDYLLSIGFVYEGQNSIINDDEEYFDHYKFMSEKHRAFKHQKYTHSVQHCPQSGRTIIWTYRRGNVFHGTIKSVEDLKKVFSLIK